MCVIIVVRVFLSILFLCFTLISCEQGSGVYSQTVIPEKVESARTDLENTSSGVNKAIVQSEKLKNTAEDSKQTVIQQRADIDEAIANAMRLQEKLAANIALKEIEVANLVAHLEKVKSQNASLENQNSRLWSDLLDQEEILQGVQESATIARAKVEDLESQNGNLRSILEKEISDKTELLKEKKGLEKAKQKLATDLASASVYKNWILTIVWGYLALLILKNVAASVWPQAGVTKLLGRI